jgi:Stealth protein CR2, conserved region 2/Stealth protein CR4, conserved region 4/Stealth protein CR3, conserved region 3
VAPIDVVYTWVDDTWPGYDALLRRYAADRHDLNPNRYRDNVDILRYNLRSLDRHAPWIERVFLVTCRPQVPRWLDTATVRVVHHDQFMDAADLPTFNSFAIVANLHRIPGLSPRFVYIEDDRLFGSRVEHRDLFDDDGRPRVFLTSSGTRMPSDRHNQRLSPWNRAVAYSNLLLNARYGAKPRRMVSHGPLAIDVDAWRAMIAAWPEAFRRTSASRFRATENVAPEYLYPHFLLEERRGVPASRGSMRSDAAYQPLNNIFLFQWIGLARLRWRRPKFFCLNDDFGVRPNPRVVGLVTRELERWFPQKSRFELSEDQLQRRT